MSSRRFDQETHDRLMQCLGYLHDTAGPSGPHRPEGGRLDVNWPVGCYIATAHTRTVKYIGKICRSDTGFDARLGSHHQPIDTWAIVWLVPLRADLDNRVVEAVEATLIAVFCPTDNRVRPRGSIIRVADAA